MTAPTASHPAPQPVSLSTARDWFAQNGLTRLRKKRMLSGVSGGLARRYGVDRLVMRLAILAGVIFLSPLVYLALWVLMPRDPAPAVDEHDHQTSPSRQSQTSSAETSSDTPTPST